MTRIALLAIPLILAACGGDKDDDSGDTGTTAAGTGTGGTATGGTATGGTATGGTATGGTATGGTATGTATGGTATGTGGTATGTGGTATGTGTGGTAFSIDGVWDLTGTQCDGVDALSPPFVLDVSGTSGTFTLTMDAQCVAVLDEDYVITADTVEIIPTGITCDPGASCPELGFDCAFVPPPVTFDYAQTTDMLVFEKPSFGPPVDPCPKGELLTYTMTKR